MVDRGALTGRTRPLGSRAMMDQVMAGHYTRAQPMQPTFTTRPDIRGTFGAVVLYQAFKHARGDPGGEK